jgi:predicted nucleotidyltransferase
VTVAGVIAEFNPFHSGHAQLLEAVRGCADLTVVAMSGNFVQRGGVAVYSKFLRAKAAVDSGLADLVLEIPIDVSLSSAQGFAVGAVRFLEDLGLITHLAFGSESGKLDELRAVADYLKDKRFDAFLTETLKSGVSYPAARQTALERIAGMPLPLLQKPNNILAIEYLSALDNSRIEPLTFTRPPGSVSATRLREILQGGGDISEFIPLAAQKAFDGVPPLFEENISSAILTNLKAKPREHFTLLPGGNSEGFGNRLFNAVQASDSLQTLYAAAKTKRYTLSRIRRAVYYAYLGIPAAPPRPRYATVLAANKRGRELKCAIPLKRAGRDDFHGFARQSVL